MKRANHWLSALGLIAMSAFAQSAMAATCTSLSAGDWNVAARWDCGGVNRIPLTTDSVVIAHNAIRMRANYTVVGLIVNAGAVLDGNNKNLTVNGAVSISGTYNTAGGGLTTTGGGALTVNAGGTFDFNGGNAAINGNVVINGTLSSGGDAMQMTGANTTLSGTGNVVNTAIEIDATGVSVPVGANLVFDATSQIDVGANNPGSLTINGTIDGTAQAVGTRIIRVSSGGALTIGTTGVINAPNSQLNVRNGATAINNGTITIRDIIGRTGTLPVFTQGANSTLNVSGTICATACTFNASAAGNVVNYTGAAQTVYLPSGSTYANLTLGGSGAKTLPTGLTVAGNFTMSGSATVAAPAALTVGGNFSIGAGNTFTPGTGTVTLNGVTAQTIGGGNPVNFNNLTVTNAASPNLTLATNVTVTGTLTGTVVLTSTCPADYTLTSTTPAQVLHSCTGPNHILITHGGSALTCTPQTVTITACADAGCTANYAGGVSVTLTPGGQTFAIGATGINSAATVQQSTAGVAVALAATSIPAATTTCWNTATLTASCAMDFNDSGFLITVPNHTSCSNATATIEAVQTAPGTGRCVPAYQNVTRAVNLYSTYVSPVTGTQVITASTGVVSTATPGTAHNLAFDATGTATITLSYPDAGQLTLTAIDTAPTGAAMTNLTGSGSFVVAPASFAFSAIPAAPLTAGLPFNATVTAMNACATPAATPNFDGTVTITSSNPLPAIGNATAINTTLSGFINGAASMNLTWDEVGTIDLNANLANYLGTALSVSGIQAGAGRFHPAYFDTVVTQGCGTFTYAGTATPVKLGQPFTVTVTANKTGGGVTANYAGAANAYLTTLSNAGVTAGFASNTIAAASFANGVGSANATFEVATPQTAPLTLTLRAEDADITMVSSFGHTEGITKIRSGRAKISNAHGSELLALPVLFRAEYWSGGWVINAADTCSGDGLSGGSVGVTLAGLAATCVQDSGSPGLSGAGCAAAGPAGKRFKEGGVVGFAGNFNLWLKAPGAGNTGAVTVNGNVPAWLRYPWSGGTAIDPTARATFGVYKGGDEFIYLRENY